jgi:threonine/homoserine/homoserine lactone efflux protein
MIGISGAMIPGPLTLFTVSEVLKTDRFAGLKVVFGHIISEFVIIGIIFLGFHKFLGSEKFVSLVSIIGGLALIIMGIILFLNAPKMNVPREKSNAGFNKGLILGGIFFSAVSPGFIIWWATIGISTVVRALLYGFAGVIILSLGHWSADVIWYWSMSYGVEKGKKYLSDRSYQNIMRLLAGLLMILGAGFLAK